MEKSYSQNKELYNSPESICPLCGSDSILELYHITRYNNPFSITTCRECSFQFMNPRFNQKVIEQFYNKEYYEGTADYAYFDERDTEKFPPYVLEKRVEKIHRFIKSGKFLDVGSSFGGLLNSAKKYYMPFGIEVSPYAGNYTKKEYGDSIHIGTLVNHSFKKQSFSVITMIEVLEHLHNPVVSLKECYDLLAEGGLFVIQTANMDGIQAKILKDNYAYYMPGHLSYFTKNNLTNTLKNIGFSKIKHFHPVEFGLLPKLKKSRKSFSSVWDYRKWFRITLYHVAGKIHWGNFTLTSSLVTYAFK